LLSNDDWRRAHQVDRALSEADLEELFEDKVVFVDGKGFIVIEMVIEAGILWEVTHSGVTVMFWNGDLFEEGGILVFSIEIFGL